MSGSGRETLVKVIRHAAEEAAAIRARLDRLEELLRTVADKVEAAPTSPPADPKGGEA